ncbi:hypothetical protein SELMODRAFT_416237 [Selaginella moellendorffii]|uniref:Uncharacterized protein n=1 Tax=Selaginella moellendorffii TaxID=88036 RepID=D8RYI6_SELML|nr:hypothetical protein SELMODRAFT_416237 [Selaginella moellendorffii]
MAYRYLNHCSGHLVYTASVLLKLLTSGKKLAPIAQNVRRQLHSDDVQENVGETSQHAVCRCTNAFFPSLPTAIEDDLQELSSSASYKQVCPLSPTGSVGNVKIVIRDYF